MLRRLEQLDEVDRQHGLGAMPLGTAPDAPARHRRRRRRTTGPVLPGLLISGILAGGVMLHDPGMTGYRFRQLVDNLTGSGGGSYAFVATTAGGDPVGWDHCESIHYVVNPDGGPADWQNTVEDGIEEISGVSGFTFTFDGTTKERSFDQPLTDPLDPPPVLIGWADASEVPDLKGSTAGIGGSTPVRSGGRVQFATGVVVLDSEAYDRMEVSGETTAERLILAHELGHVLGLDHVDDIGELMNAEYVGQSGFGPGDREGLRQLHALPCR